MSMSVLTDKARTVESKYHMIIHEADICDHLVISTLQER